MKLLAFVGSPRKKGNGNALVEALCAGAKKNGHETRIFHLIDQEVKPCIACYACMSHKIEICIHEDDFNTMAREIIAADTLVFATPVYMGQISGLMKVFFDRWITFSEPDFSIRHVNGKRFVTIVTSGAPAKEFKSVTTYLKHWLGKFFKMKHAGSITGGELHELNDIKKQPELLEEAKKLGESLYHLNKSGEE